MDEKESISIRQMLLRKKVDTYIKKVQKIFKAFRKFPLKKDKLQEYVTGSKGNEKTLFLDVKKRWKSMGTILC